MVIPSGLSLASAQWQVPVNIIYISNTNPGQDWSHGFQSPQWQIPILARIGHMLFSLPNGKYQSWPGLVTCFSVSPMANTNPGQDWSHAFQSPQWQIPILARIGHMLFSLPNGKYQSWPGLVTCFSVSPMANTNPGQDWSHAFQSPQLQIPILARIVHMLFSLPNAKYQSR